MSHSASWYLLWLIGGIRIDQLRGEIDIRPFWSAEWGDTLTDLPVFLPGFQAQVNAC